MAGLGLLLWGTLKAIGHIGCAVENAQSKKSTAHYDNKGNVVSNGYDGTTYYNGEKTYSWYETDKYGNDHYLTIGVNSGKVYSDSFDNQMSIMDKDNEERKARAIKRGRGTYMKYDPRFQCQVSTEVSTDRVIACLYKGSIEPGKMEYRKFYINRQNPGRFGYNQSDPGDYGVIISKEEYDKLYEERGVTYSGIPYDDDVWRYFSNRTFAVAELETKQKREQERHFRSY